MLTVFGSCRVDGLNGNNNLNNTISYLHNTKEMIQMIQVLRKELILKPPYNKLCFRNGILYNKPIEINNDHINLFNNSNVVILEICSIKKYIHNNYYLHHMAVSSALGHVIHKDTPKYIADTFSILKQDYDELENDIIILQKMLYPKKIIIVTHYNAKLDGEYISSRNFLINALEQICNKNNIYLINPSIVLENMHQSEVLKEDLGHYTSKGANMIKQYINDFIQSILNISD